MKLYEPADDGHFTIQGPDAVSYLQRMVTNEVKELKVNEANHQALLDRKGHVLSLFYLIRTGDDSFHAVCPPGLLQKTVEILKKTKFREQFEIKEVTGEWKFWIYFGEVPPTEKSYKESIYALPCWNLLVQTDWQPDPAISRLSKQEFDLIRIQSGIPEYPADVNEGHILLEANLHYAVKRNKGCYPGQEVIERIYAYGKGRTPRQLVTLYAEGKKEIPGAIYDPLKNRTLVMTMVERKVLESSKGTIQIGNNICRILKAD